MSEGNIVYFDGITSLKIPAERVLKMALEADLESVVVVGYCQDGSEYFASSNPDAAECGWLLQRGIWMLNTTIDNR